MTYTLNVLKDNVAQSGRVGVKTLCRRFDSLPLSLSDFLRRKNELKPRSFYSLKEIVYEYI